jgi:hypothetical protein
MWLLQHGGGGGGKGIKEIVEKLQKDTQKINTQKNKYY